MEKGTLVEIKVQGDRRLAVMDRLDGKKHVLLDAQGHVHKVHPREITFQIPNLTFKPEELEAFFQDVTQFLDPSSLEIAWELLVEDGEATDPTDLAQILFSSQSPVCCYAAHRLLADDKLFFKQKGDRYEPRSASQVQELKHQLEVSQRRQQESESFFDLIQQALQAQQRANLEDTDPNAVALDLTLAEGSAAENPSPQIALRDPCYRQRIDALERFAVFAEEAPNRTMAIELLTQLDRPPTAQGAHQLLVDLGLWTLHENLALRRSQIRSQFSAEALELAQQRLAEPPFDPDGDRRLDLTHLKVYTIDDESTREIDDGLSLELLPDGRQKLWIHIADPTRWLQPDDPLDLEARRRSTTVYLPTGAIPMFPLDLATGPMSLVQGQICCALSFGVVLEQSGTIAETEIQPSRIKPTYRLTYEDVDEILDLRPQAEAEITTIADWARCRQQWRQSRGAITINMPESQVKVRGNEIEIIVLEDSQSRQLVAEMMILAGEVAGQYALRHGLAMPFRHQPQPELPPESELLQLPAGPVRFSAIRRCMTRSEISTTPARHASLGLDTYIQVTSPIRRYSDLLSHFQLKAHLRGDSPPFSDRLPDLIHSIGTAAYEAVLVERQTNRYWSLEYLRRQGDRVWSGLMLRWLRDNDNLAIVLLEDLGLELVTRLDLDLKPGDRFGLQATYVDPRQDVIHLRAVAEDAVEMTDTVPV